jgi:Rubredoxin
MLLAADHVYAAATPAPTLPYDGHSMVTVHIGRQQRASLSHMQELPGDWQCPVCGAPKNTFQTKEVTVAGFAQNQKCAHISPMLSSQACNQTLNDCACVGCLVTTCHAKFCAHNLQSNHPDEGLMLQVWSRLQLDDRGPKVR